MSSKHETLSEADMRHFRMNPALLGQIREYAKQLADRMAPLRILDWGCGRGRSVAFLRHEGFDAFGIDIDHIVLRNGYNLLRVRGHDPEQLLRHTDSIDTFEDNTFDIVFSEETLEHVVDLSAVARESFRLLRPGGLAVHSFPGSRWLVEPHVHMPLVHWLPQGDIRRLIILLCILFGLGPRPPWPEARYAVLRQKLAVYDRYLVEKTCYRSRKEIMGIFTDAGFVGRWLGNPSTTGWRQLLPSSLRDNGFPAGHLLLQLIRPS